MIESDDPHRRDGASDEPARGGGGEAPGQRSRPLRSSAIGTLAGIAALVVLLFTVLVWQPWALRYKRFVSRPLPGGTRYTFLYPAHLQNLQENGKGASPEVIASATVWTMNRTAPTLWDELQRRLGFSVPSPAESVSVVVFPVHPRPLRDRRTDARWERMDDRRHNLYLVDARTGLQFSLYHDAPSEAAASFEAHDRVIARSFRVLPPGAAP
jgi:hypothetical protein